MQIYCRPNLCATAPVVPDPAKKSKTISSELVVSSIIRLRSCSGFLAFVKLTPHCFCVFLKYISVHKSHNN